MLRIKQILKEPTLGDMRDNLLQRPQNLQEAFHETLSRLGDPSSDNPRTNLAWIALIWLAESREPLQVDEVRSILTRKAGHIVDDPRYCPTLDRVLEWCHGLILVDETSSVVRLVHLSLREYLKTAVFSTMPGALSGIAHDCLTYMSFLEFFKGPLTDDVEMEERLARYPFSEYCCQHIFYHVQRAAHTPAVLEYAFRCAKCQPLFSALTQLRFVVMGYNEGYYSKEECESMRPLHFAPSFRQANMVRRLLHEYPNSINARTVMGSTPVVEAASTDPGRSLEVLKLLLHYGADPYLRNWYGNALHCAAEVGNADAIYALSKWGMRISDPTVWNDGVKPALLCTLDRDSAAAAMALLDCGVNPDATREHTNILFAAISENCVEVARSVIRRRAVEFQAVDTVRGLTALQVATLNVRAEIVSELLQVMPETPDRASYEQLSGPMGELSDYDRLILSETLSEVLAGHGYEDMLDKLRELLL